MAKRRGNSEGSIIQRHDSPKCPPRPETVGDDGTVTVGERPSHKCEGRWVATVDQGWKDGKRARKSLYGKTRADVAGQLRVALQQVADGMVLPDAKLTTEAFLTYWLSDVLPGSVKKSTATHYGSVVRLYVTPHIGKVRLAKLTPANLTTWTRTLEKAGLAPRTRKQARAILVRALRDAVRLEFLPRNPLSAVPGPEIGRAGKTDDALTSTEARHLLAVMGEHVMPETRSKHDPMTAPRYCDVEGCRNRSHAYEACFRLALSVGLRKAELLGLRWDDIDLDAGTLTVRRQLKWITGEGFMFDTPKTDAAKRTIPLPASAVKALRDHRVKQLAERLAAGPEWQEDGLVFCTHTGTPVDPSALLRRYQETTERAGLGKRRLHGARHTAATLMLEAGVPLEVVGAILGHSDFRVTVDVYAHLSHTSLRRGSDAMEVALGG